MKEPRTNAFDPHVKEHKLTSSMADFPAIEKPSSTPVQDDTRTVVPPVPPVLPVREVPLHAVNKRKMRQRHPFDIYEDQYDELRNLALDEKMCGGAGSMSAMVREAIDDYISKAKGRMEP